MSSFSSFRSWLKHRLFLPHSNVLMSNYILSPSFSLSHSHTPTHTHFFIWLLDAKDWECVAEWNRHHWSMDHIQWLNTLMKINYSNILQISLDIWSATSHLQYVCSLCFLKASCLAGGRMAPWVWLLPYWQVLVLKEEKRDYPRSLYNKTSVS